MSSRNLRQYVLRFVRFAGRALNTVISSFGIAAAPARYLWPWILSTAIFVMLIRSPQGAALARSIVTDDYSFTAVALTLIAAWLLTTAGCLLALLATSEARVDPSREGSKSNPLRPWKVVVDGSWLLALSAGPAIVFASVVHHAAAVPVAGLLTLIIVITTLWLASSSRYRSLISACETTPSAGTVPLIWIAWRTWTLAFRRRPICSNRGALQSRRI